MKKPGKQSFPYSLACYPTSWKEYVISPQKICMQFQGTQLKTRAPHSKERLKSTPWGSHEMPVDTQGTDIDTLAVGIPLHLYPTVLKNILTALSQHHELHPEHSIQKQIQEILRDFTSTDM